MKSLVLLFVVFGLAGCASIQERLAKRVGCDPTKLTIQNELHVPAYTEYNFTCDGRKYTCRQAPFHDSCGEDHGKKDDATKK